VETTLRISAECQKFLGSVVSCDLLRFTEVQHNPAKSGVVDNAGVSYGDRNSSAGRDVLLLSVPENLSFTMADYRPPEAGVRAKQERDYSCKVSKHDPM
jgi:hypothetical protein